MKILALAIAILLSGCTTLASKESAVACQAADVVTTKAALMSGAGQEANPIMRGLLAHGFAPFLLVKAGMAWWLIRDETPDEARVAANVITCGVAASNMRFIK